MSFFRAAFFSCLISFAFGKSVSLKSPPKWPDAYSVEGILRLPYAEIVEPFEAWFDGKNRRSRIDYYADGKPFGVSYRLCPETTEEQMDISACFVQNGTKDTPVSTQTFSGYKEYSEGRNCSVWVYVKIEGYKKNTYTMYTSGVKFDQPVHYEMMGYDTLFGSHYDQYEMDYMNYSDEAPPSSVFDIMEGEKCTGFPDSGAMSSLQANPMHEFIGFNGHEKVHEMFEHFLSKFPRRYANTLEREEHNKRRDIFRQNLRFINSHNRKHVSFKAGINHLADRSPEEITGLRGRAVTPVKDQGVCGSCWSFGTTGTIEGALFLKTNQSVLLSQQNLIDCSWGFGNDGCDGGLESQAYQWIMKHNGIASAETYGQYLAVNGYCHFDYTVGAKLSSYVNVTSGDLNALKIAIFQNGPVSVGIDASHRSFAFYSFGVYYEPKCGNKPQDLDHAVLAVGYGTMNGQAYWLIKNSWSTHWGNTGYVLMSQKDNNCGVATDATYVNIAN
ncbi:Counting factor associated protein D [Acropora cervicornis]|uniref:Counting factor associated protein D n=1 Tax=Acropora cervicornis TaxID=6130 RepID=A0AAD9R7A3_ACRCE|nr:Counting factor associated protein D [Acropora cervicornis]